MRAETLHYHKDQAADYTRFNNYQRPYLEVGNTFDAQHFLSSKTAYYRISQTSETTQYTYNQIGLLATKATFMDSTKVAKEEWRYRYDQWGNLIEMHKYENGTFMHDYQIVYDYKTGFLGSIIKKDLKSDQMSILRFTAYTYYPKP
jgi:YD repeat-containing protein